MTTLHDRTCPTIDANLVARARELVPLLTFNAARADRERRIPNENLTELRDAGLLRMMTPRRWGGHEAGFETKISVVSELARGCAATSWVLALLTGGAWFVGMMNEQAQQDVWGNGPDTTVAVAVPPSGTAEIVDGGYRVSGRWPYCSGVEHADWVLLGARLAGPDGQPAPIVTLVPRDQVDIEDTWHVTGMRGTGSNTVVATGVTVPSHRTISLGAVEAGHVDTPFVDEAPYHVPLTLGALSDLTGPQLGLARAALDLVIDNAARRGVSATTYSRQTEAPTVQVAVARAASSIDTAQALVLTAAQEMDRAGRTRVRPALLDRARMHTKLTRGIAEARDAIRELMSVAGSSAFAEANPLQRIWRDSEIASSHAVSNPAISAEVYGRLLLGVDEPMVIPL
ncbi:oxidoreductase [Mycobacterium kubicae]|uniref:acyl-CoA dehydrogenase family protein n=1 Tax=Mycobacterium kubicae TaxID=120959 RepID=UPI0016417CA5|nr:acyl-CoA dehydrogenase family protein [Mycobacterium kubicae]QNI07545.1 oxidoreductase [Mycobacterium kubicae]